MRTIDQEQKAKSTNHSAELPKCYYHMSAGHGVTSEQKGIFHEKPYYLTSGGVKKWNI